MRIKRIIIAAIGVVMAAGIAHSADPMSTDYSFSECEGTYMPYPSVKPVACPDSLVPVMINHVGRHGARFPSSDKNLKRMAEALDAAAAQKTITDAGRSLRKLIDRIDAATAGQWGALDSLGMAEQAGIATRMVTTWPSLFEGGRIDALSSYAPRCIMSMYCFTHQLARMNNRLEIYTSSGRQNSALVRPFDSNEDYREYREGESWKVPLAALEAQLVTRTALERVLGAEFAWPEDEAEVRGLAMAEYAVVSCAAAIGIDADARRYFTAGEYNALWAVSNLRHYLTYSSSTLSTAPAEMAAPLLRALIDTTDAAAEGRAQSSVLLRFGHAETLMPLLALMHLPGCYYMTNYFDTVATHWRDFYLVPMAANLQLILLKHKENGRLYLRVDLNEKPVTLIPGRTAVYTSWEAAREYLTRCLPLLWQ